MARIVDLITVDGYSGTPKYLQIANSIIREIEKGVLKVGENMPSINELSIELDIARDTVERSYKHLKNIGVLDSVPRRGYYVLNAEMRNNLKIFLLFNKLSAHKKTIYDAFVNRLGDQALIDFYVYNNNIDLFTKLINTNRGDYSHYVIIPHFLEREELALEAIRSLPSSKLIFLDKTIAGFEGCTMAAIENFEADIYQALEQALLRLKKYHTIKLIFPEQSYYPTEIERGLKRFCVDNGFKHSVISDINAERIGKGVLYLSLMESDLVDLIECVLKTRYKIGIDVGILSYNEVPIKKYILNGIATVSTDFEQMGDTAARLVLGEITGHIEVPFRLTVRKSI